MNRPITIVGVTQGFSFVEVSQGGMKRFLITAIQDDSPAETISNLRLTKTHDLFIRGQLQVDDKRLEYHRTKYICFAMQSQLTLEIPNRDFVAVQVPVF